MERYNTYTCKRMRLLTFLMDKGFMPFVTLPDKDNPSYRVWKFHYSDELQEALDEWFGQYKK